MALCENRFPTKERMAIRPPLLHTLDSPKKFALHTEASPKNLNLDDHFDRSFLFMTMKGNLMKTKTKLIAPTPDINKTGRTRLAAIFRWPLLLALLILLPMVQAQWTATVGAQPTKKGIQAWLFSQ